jgi:PAS domain-containing protein
LHDFLKNLATVDVYKHLIPGANIMITPDIETSEKLAREDDLVDNERTLSHLLNKLRHQYRNTIMTGEADRIGFEALLKDVEVYFNLAETQNNHTIEILRAENKLVTKDRDIKIKEWRERYEKIQYRWNDLTEQLSKLQKDKEEIRIQRDQLLTTHKQKGRLMRDEKNANSTSDRRSTFERTLADLLTGITESLEADRATIFLYSAPSDELRSIAIYPVPKDESALLEELEIDEEEYHSKIPKEIRIPASKGIAGAVFTSGIPENIENAYSDKRFFQAVDKMTGCRTKLILTYPIYSVRADSIIGVLQLINKKNGEGSFGLQDEARCTEFASFLSYVFASVHDLYDFLPSSQTNGSHPTKKLSDRNLLNGQSPMTTDNSPLTPSSELPPDFGKSSSTDYSNGIIPKGLDDYIKKLEQCWRRAVGESAQWQNKLSQMENENRKAKSKIYGLERKVAELEEINKEVKEKMLKNHKEYKIAKQDLLLKETEMKNELNACRSANQQLLVEQMKSGNEDTVKNIILPVSSVGSPVNRVRGNTAPSITLPYIDLKSQSKKIVLNLGGSDIANQLSPKVPELVLPSNLQPSSPRGPLGAQPPLIPTGSASPLKVFTSTANVLSMSATGSPTHAVAQVEYTFTQSSQRTPVCKEIFLDVFTRGPAPMILLSKEFRIWRVNNKFCDMLECDEQSLLGLTLSDISIGVEFDTLPRLLQFDIVQGLAICRPNDKLDSGGHNRTHSSPNTSEELNTSMNLSPGSRSAKQKKKKNFTKVNIQISQLGVAGEKYRVLKSSSVSRLIKAPIFALVFSKAK